MRRLASSILFVVGMSLPAAALDLTPDRLMVPLGSKHINYTGDNTLNEFNPGLALTWDHPFADLTLGAYYGSYEEWVPFGTLSKDLWSNSHCTASAFLGLADYSASAESINSPLGDFVPMVGGNLTCGHAFVQVSPAGGAKYPGPDGATTDALVAFGFTTEIDW